MITKAKIGIVVAIAAVIGALLFWIQKQKNELAELKAKNGELVGQLELKDGTTRNMSSYASKEDIERLIKESGLDLKVIEEDLKKLDSDLQGVQRLVVDSQGFRGDNLRSTSTTRGKNEDGTPIVVPTAECADGSTISCPDTFGYLTNRQVITLQEPFADRQVPIGQTGFSAWKENPWDVEIYPRQYQVTNVVSVNDDGKTNMHSQVTITSNGESVIVPIENANYVENYPKAKFRFNPRLYFGVDAGFAPYNIAKVQPDAVGEIIPGAQVFLFSHGKTKLDTDWAILGLGLGYATQNRALGFTLSPIHYNVGKPIPLIENLFLGPTVGLDTKGNLSFLLGLKVGL